MSKLFDLVEVKKDSFFNGAVQAEWFYDKSRRKRVAESYIFHGPKYYGVTSEDIDTKNHKLSDTVSFTKTIYKKISEDIDTSRFALTIADYGAGKSHLSVALSTLLSGDDKDTCKEILENIKNADKEGYEYINDFKDNKHLVLVLNGINDFNLNKEILRVAKESLALHKIDDNIFEDMSIAYKTASTFLTKTFDYLTKEYKEAAKNVAKYKIYSDTKLKEILLKDIEKYETFEIVNKVYKSQTGNDISIVEGISAGMVLDRLYNKLVVEEKLFESIIIIFDEFGRYLEFASTQPGLAGEAAIQQIFEAVQNSSPKMLFVGFIQSDLNAYMDRVNNDNIARYVTRYQTSDKYYLSSNIETVLASLIKKKNNSELIISNIFDNTLSSFASTSQKNILRWMPELGQKNVWNSPIMYKRIILKGCYPVHPLTLSTLANLSKYMQQRSSLTFLSDIFSKHANDEIDERIPFIYPAALINSPIFNELINAEERQRVPGQNCIQYGYIMDANEEILNNIDKNILASILVMNICKFKIYDKEDLKVALETISGVSGNTLLKSLDNLENKLGVIYFDSSINRYNFMSEGNSKLDYNKLLSRKRLTVRNRDIISSLPEDIKNELKLGIIEQTNFGRKNYICSNEWSFIREIIDINDFTYEVAKSLRDNMEKEIYPDSSRGKIIYLYCNKESFSKISDVVRISNELEFDKTTVLIALIYDINNQITDSIINIRTLNKFSPTERESFNKYFNHSLKEESQKIIRIFMECAKKRQYITKDGISVAESYTQQEIVKRFEKVYTKTIPFTIDAFEKKIGKKARGYFNSIVDCLLKGKLEDIVEYNNLEIDIKNRINSILSVQSEKGWKVLYEGNVISKPLHPIVNEIYLEIESEIKSYKKIKFRDLINKYTKAPYGLNIYAATLVIIYSVTMNKDNLNVYKGLTKSRVSDILSCFNDDQKEQFNEFSKYLIEYTEISEKDKILATIEKIEKNRSIAIDQVEILYNELKDINILDITADLRGRYYSCESTLKIALDKNIEINNKLKESEINYNKLDRNPFLLRVILNHCNTIKEGVIAGSTYRYSIEQLNMAEEIKRKSFEKFKTSIKRYGEICSLENEVNIGNYYKNTMKQLPLLDANELVTIVNESYDIFLKRVEKNKNFNELINKINNSINKLKVDIELIRNLENCETVINKWLDKKIELESENNKNLNTVFLEIEKLKDKIELIKSNTSNLLDEAVEIIISISSLKDLDKGIEKIENIINKPMLQSTKNKIIDFKIYLIDIEKTLQEFKYRRFTKEEVDNSIRIINNKYSEYEKILLMVDNIKFDLLNIVKTNNEEWKVKYIDKYSNLDEYSVDELKKLVINASIDEKYLSLENKALLKNLVDMVENKLSKYKLDNILSIFKELSPEAKKKCIQILHDNV